MHMRICLYTEELHCPFDEGYKNFIYRLMKAAPSAGTVLRLGQGDSGVIDEQIEPGRLLMSSTLRKAVREFKPDVVVYIPAASITTGSFVRSRMLKMYSGNARVVMVGLQPRDVRPGARSLAPDVVYVQSEAQKKRLEDAGFRTGLVRAGVDALVFKPVSASEKAALREAHNIKPDAYVVLHVGHINERRNLRALTGLTDESSTKVVVVGSSSTISDPALVTWLRERGVWVRDGYVKRVEEMYQLADAYAFPVTDNTAAIELPLSVLEAMSCNLPVITTRFGGLPDCFEQGEGLVFVDDPGRIPEALAAIRQGGRVNTRAKVKDYAWDSVTGRFFDEIRHLVRPTG